MSTTFARFTPVNVLPDYGGTQNLPLVSTGGGTQWTVLPIAGGGTGQTTAQAALDALTIGNVNLTGTGARIRGDFNNATVASRTMFQTRTTNASTQIGILPNGAVTTNSTAAALHLEDVGSVSTGNGSVFSFANVQGSEMRIVSDVRGTGTQLPISLYLGGLRAVHLTNTSGNTTLNILGTTASLTLTPTVANSAVSLNVLSGAVPHGQLRTVNSNAWMHYDFSGHVFRTAAGGHLFTIGSAGQLGVGTGTTSFGTSGQFLMSNGATAAPTWSSQLPTGSAAVTQPAGTSNTTIATTEFVAGATVANARLLGGAAASVPATPNTIAQRDASGNLFANVFNGRATSANYADLAEKYTTDAEYPVGTVIVVGENDDSECTQSTKVYQYVVGVISENPAYLMNNLSDGQAVALTGKVPVRVIGPVRKGQRLVSSDRAGCAIVGTALSFATALETNENVDEKLVMCIVVK